MIGLVQHNSLLISLFIFYPVPALLSKLTSLPIFEPNIFFPIMAAPLLLGLRRIHIAGIVTLGSLVASIILSCLFVPPDDITLNYTVALIISFAIPACVLPALPFDISRIRYHFIWLAPLNLFLLLYLVIFRQDIYLDREQMNYMTFGYWSLISLLAFTVLYLQRSHWIWPVLGTVCFISIILFGSRFAVVVAVSSWFFLYSYFIRSRIRIVLTFLFFVFFGMTAILLREVIIDTLIKAAEAWGLSPINLYRLKKIELSGVDLSSQGRLELLQQSFILLLDRPWGAGIYGYYEVLAGETGAIFKYPHNLFLQLSLEYGILGVFILTAIGARGLWLIFLRLDPAKGWLSVMQVCMCTKLLVSGNYLWEPAFWLAIVLGWKAYSSRFTCLQSKQEHLHQSV